MYLWFGAIVTLRQDQVLDRKLASIWTAAVIRLSPGSNMSWDSYCRDGVVNGICLNYSGLSSSSSVLLLAYTIPSSSI